MTTSSHPTESTEFVRRHVGISRSDEAKMLADLGFRSLEQMIDAAVPPAIRTGSRLDLPPALSEREVLAELSRLSEPTSSARP